MKQNRFRLQTLWVHKTSVSISIPCIPQNLLSDCSPVLELVEGENVVQASAEGIHLCWIPGTKHFTKRRWNMVEPWPSFTNPMTDPWCWYINGAPWIPWYPLTMLEYIYQHHGSGMGMGKFATASRAYRFSRHGAFRNFWASLRFEAMKTGLQKFVWTCHQF